MYIAVILNSSDHTQYNNLTCIYVIAFPYKLHQTGRGVGRGGSEKIIFGSQDAYFGLLSSSVVSAKDNDNRNLR